MTSTATTPSIEVKQITQVLQHLLSQTALSPRFQLKSGHLKVLVSYPTGSQPDSGALVKQIRSAVDPMPKGELQSIVLYGRAEGHSQPDWMQTIHLQDPPGSTQQSLSSQGATPASTAVVQPPVQPQPPAQPQPPIQPNPPDPRIPAPPVMAKHRHRSAPPKSSWGALRQALLAVVALGAMASVGVHIYLRWLHPEAQISFEIPDGSGGYQQIQTVIPAQDADQINRVIQELERAIQGGEWQQAVQRIDALREWFPDSAALVAYRDRIAGSFEARRPDPVVASTSGSQPSPAPASRDPVVSQLAPRDPVAAASSPEQTPATAPDPVAATIPIPAPLPPTPVPAPPAPPPAPTAPTPALSYSELQQNLRRQVSREDWPAALATADQILVVAPAEMRAELEAYRQRLRELVAETSPPESYLSRSFTPPPAPTPVPERTTDPSQLQALTPPAPAEPRPSDASQLGPPIQAAAPSSSSSQGATDSQGLTSPNQPAPPGPPAVAAREDVNWDPWLADLKRRVEGNWIPGQQGSSRRTVVVFSVGRNGSLSNPRISRSSGHQPTDEMALQAVSRGAPFLPLPANYVGDAVQINFTFDINVQGQLEGGGRRIR